MVTSATLDPIPLKPLSSCSLKTGGYKNFAKFPEKHVFQSHFFNKVAGLSTFFKEHFQPTASELNSEHLFELVTTEINAMCLFTAVCKFSNFNIGTVNAI